MRLRIHRGTAEIGGNCIQVEASGKSLLLDMGMPLSGNTQLPDVLPRMPGVTDGSNSNLLGIVISHPHADHYGLAVHAHPSIPIYIGQEADKILRAAAPFTPFSFAFANAIHYHHRQPFQIGPFTLTPYLIDHSAFDAYSFLIEADGRRVFYSGDLRGHGWKSRTFNQLVTNGPKGVDVMLLEGTTLGRDDKVRSETENDLVGRITESIKNTQGLVLTVFAGQNIDRFVTFYKAARASGRQFVADLYLAHLLRALGRKTLPDPTSDLLRVYLPRNHKRKIVQDQRFDLVKPFYGQRIYPDELSKKRKKLMMVFRSSMMRELQDADCCEGAKLIYSMWPGYIERSTPDLRKWCTQKGIEFEIIHTSGHADAFDLKRLVEGVGPRALIPIHTMAPHRFSDLSPNIIQLSDGQWLDI